MKQKVELFTDGASRGNPGPAGYGLILKYGRFEKEHSAGYRRSTNNRMELMAVIVGLEALNKPNQTVIVYSDSKYVVDAVEKGWLFEWQQINFKNKKNADLWKRFLIVFKKHDVSFVWIRGHNDHPYNERCDQLAVAAALEPTLVDKVYEEEEEQKKSES